MTARHRQFGLSSRLKRGALGTFPLLLRSFTRQGVTQRRVTVDVVSEEPLIWVVDGLCEQRQVQQLKDVLRRQKLDNLKKTDAYVDDMFDERRELREDAQMLVSMISSGALQTVPAEYQEDPLRSLLWTAMRRPELLQSSDWDLALLSTARRAWPQIEPTDAMELLYPTAIQWASVAAHGRSSFHPLAAKDALFTVSSRCKYRQVKSATDDAMVPLVLSFV
eukprot:s1184_g15.t1